MFEDKEPKWILNMGCHRYTITSRDSGTQEFDNREAAIADWQRARKFWATIGYVVWFAELIAPDGSKTMLEQNSSYDR